MKQCITFATMNQREYIFDLDSFSKDLLTKRVVDMRIDLREAAKQVGISAATLSRLENKNKPDNYNYFCCCKWLGVPMSKYFVKSSSITHN